MKKFIAILSLTCSLSAQVVDSVYFQRDCLPQNLPTLLKIIEEGSDHYKILDAITCVSKLSKDQSIKVLLIKKLENTLRGIKSHHDNEFSEKEPELIVALAEVIEKMGDSTGYSMIIDYFRNANWLSSRDQEFFEGIGSRIYYRPDMAEMFFLALTQLPPTTYALSRACQFFNANFNKISDPRFVRGILSAIERIEKAKEEKKENSNWTVFLKYLEEKCGSTFLTQIFNDQLWNSFVQKYGTQLSMEEKKIVDRFLIRIQSKPDSLVVEILARNFFDVQWGTAYPTSIKTSTAICDTFKSEGYETKIDDLWGYRCREESNNIKQTLYFYPDSNGKFCTLQKVRFSHPSVSKTILKTLQNRLTQQMGPGRKVNDVNEFGSAAWQEIMFWNWKGLEVYCFRNVYDSQWGKDLPLIEIIARDRQLIDLIKQEDSPDADLTNLAILPGEKPDEQITDSLSKDLKQWKAINIKTLLNNNPDSIYVMFNELLNWKSKNQQQRGAQLYLADYFIKSLSTKLGRLSDKQRKLINLSRFGIDYSPEEGVYSYNNRLMKNILNENLKGFWANIAVKWYIEIGGYDDGTEEEPNTFLKIIKYGEELLNQNSVGLLRKKILKALAEAYETWWSMSFINFEDEDGKKLDYKKDAESHRLKSIYYYEQFLNEFQKKARLFKIRETLKRLRLKLDTNCRTYYYNPGC